MSCIDDFVTYGPTTETTVFGRYLEAFIPRILIALEDGEGCDSVRLDRFNPTIQGQIENLVSIKKGQVFNRPTLANLIFTMPDIYPEPIQGEGNQYGFSLWVRAFTANGNLDWGYISVAYLAGAPYCVDGEFSPYIEYSGFTEDTVIGEWPVVIGENGIEGLSIGLTGYRGSRKPYDGFVGDMSCNGGREYSYFDELTGRSKWPTKFSMAPITYDVAQSANMDALWCCISEGYNCCGSPSNAYAPSFLIPPPTVRGPGEENVSQPPLNSVLLLSNYTFQFPDNFGAQKK